jgi:hypothetical protein
MPFISNLFFKTAIVFLIIGVAIGLQMSISGDHTVFGAHAHLNLLGWVTSAIFGGYYALNPAKAAGRWPIAHYAVYTLGIVIMIPSLYMLLRGNVAFEPGVAVGSILAFIGILMFAVVVFSPARATSRMPGAAPAE